MSKLPIKPRGQEQTVYSDKLESKHIQRISGLSDSAIHIFTIRGRDKYGNELISDPIRYVTGEDTRPSVVSNVIIETPIKGTGHEAKAQIIVSWETDEPSYGQVLWGQGSGSDYPQATEKEQQLNTKHIFIIRDLNLTTTYHLKLVSTDKVGNKTGSADSVIVTGSGQQSAINIVIKNLEEVFGFIKP